MLNEIGRICVKIAGRDAGKKCVIVEVIDGHNVLIDGATRRRKCNIAHLEPTKQVVEIKKGASHDAVKKVFDSLNIETYKVAKPKKSTQRTMKQHIKRENVKN